MGDTRNHPRRYEHIQVVVEYTPSVPHDSDAHATLEAAIRAACDAGDWKRAATVGIRGYGDELLGYLSALLRNESDAADAFAIVCTKIWKALLAFRWDCSFRTWAYTVARSAGVTIARDPYRRKRSDIEDAEVSGIAAEIRSRTATYLRTETKDRFAEVRASLAPDDQTLLVLRINRALSWREVARVLGDASDDGTEEPSDAELGKRAAALRKRFERLKQELRAQLARQGT
jgi:RNA polymerase sigma-70 factor, ECF subfamily